MGRSRLPVDIPRGWGMFRGAGGGGRPRPADGLRQPGGPLARAAGGAAQGNHHPPGGSCGTVAADPPTTDGERAAIGGRRFNRTGRQRLRLNADERMQFQHRDFRGGRQARRSEGQPCQREVPGAAADSTGGGTGPGSARHDRGSRGSGQREPGAPLFRRRGAIGRSFR